MKPSLGVMVHTQKVTPILLSVLVLIGFSDLVCRDQPGGTLWGLQHPRVAPLVESFTLGAKTLYKLASLNYCYNFSLYSLVIFHLHPVIPGISHVDNEVDKELDDLEYHGQGDAQV